MPVHGRARAVARGGLSGDGAGLTPRAAGALWTGGAVDSIGAMRVLLAFLLSLSVLMGPLGASALAGAHGDRPIGHHAVDADDAWPAGKAADLRCCDQHDRGGGFASCALHAVLDPAAQGAVPPPLRCSEIAATPARARGARRPAPPHGPPRPV